jgi:vancomycin resistance protein YoaR
MDVPLQVIEQAPPVAADLPAANPDPVALALRPLLVRDAQFGLEFAIDPATQVRLTPLRDPLQIDEAALRQLLEGWAEQIDLPARDARLRFNATTGGLTVLQTSAHGRKLDVEATAASLQEALLTGSAQATLAVVDVPPAVDDDHIAEMGIRELVASGTTYFRGSSAARIRNIEVAAAQFDGVVVPPNGIFSFNKVVESVTSANDFEDSLVIWGDQTVVGVGGGVCQVSTTVFRAAYAAGLPIVERYNHGYIVDWYGEPGQDATVFTPSVDFKFRNDTGAYLLIEPVVDSIGGEITFNFYGTMPDRVVTISAPVRSDIKQPEPPTYTVDESLALGQKKQVEWEKPGMTVAIQRTIVENGTTRTDTLTSRYVPWRAQYLVGPGVAIPATATPTAEAVVTPESTPTP